jgi:hypothetical protein
MEQNRLQPRGALKEKLLRLLRDGVAGSVVLASATLSLTGTASAVPSADARPSLAERVANVRTQAAAQVKSAQADDAQGQLAWGNWHNWRNGGSWRNWHNWSSWW